MKDLLGALAVALIGALIGALPERPLSQEAIAGQPPLGSGHRARHQGMEAGRQRSRRRHDVPRQLHVHRALPMARFALSFFPIAYYGTLTIVGAVLTLGGLAGAVAIIASLI